MVPKGSPSIKIHIGSVNITEKTKQLMNEALDKGIISQGHYTEDFENEIKKRFGVRHALAVGSGTAADTVLLAALKYLNPGKDEVIVPALTFIAHINAAYYNHLKPIFVDVGNDFQIDVSQIESKITARTLAIMPVNLLGSFCDMDAIVALGKKHNLWVITDDCEAFGSRYKDKPAGTFADAGTYSFFVSHTISCGEGGMVVTNNDQIAELITSLKNHGVKSHKVQEKFVFPRIGFNAKMNCMEAIIGLGALDSLDKYVERRRYNFNFLRKALGVDFFPEGPGMFLVHHGFPILFKTREDRDYALQVIFDAGIECRRLFSSIPTNEESYAFLGYKVGDFPVAEDLSSRALYLPVHQNLTDEDLAYMAKVVKPLLGKL